MQGQGRKNIKDFRYKKKPSQTTGIKTIEGASKNTQKGTTRK